MSKKLIIGNWKMNPHTIQEAERLFKEIGKNTASVKNSSIVLCLPAPYLFIAKKLKSKKIILGSQDVSSDADGAHTGEIAGSMLSSVGVKYVIIGHSESRKRGDTNEIVNKKTITALKTKLLPIVCIGESTRDTNGGYLAFIKQQLTECLNSIPKAQLKNIVIAYEPIWAIGAYALREATPEEFTEIRIFIRKTISDIYDAKTAHAVPVLYGGSAHPENAKAFLYDGQADGLLVGRDSLNAKKFTAIMRAVE